MKTITYNPETHVLVPRDLIADAKQIFEPNTNGDCIDVIEWFAAMMAVAPQPEPNPNWRAGCLRKQVSSLKASESAQTAWQRGFQQGLESNRLLATQVMEALRKEREAHENTNKAMTDALLMMEEREQRYEALLRQALEEVERARYEETQEYNVNNHFKVETQ